MDKYFVIPEISHHLKELGFNDPCYRGAYTNKSIVKTGYPQDFNKNVYTISLPLYSQVLDWFEDKHNLRSFIVPSYLDENKPFSFLIGKINFTELGFATREEAQLACIGEMILMVEFLKEKIS